MDFTIKKIETKGKDLVKPSPHPEILPKAPFRAMFSGASGSGKSNLILSLLTDKRFYFVGNRPYFTQIHAFSPNIYSDDAYEALVPTFVPLDHCHTTFDAEVIQSVMDKQKAVIEEKGIDNSDRVLLLFDDVIDAKIITNKVFHSVFYRGRHLNISTMIATQVWNKIPRSLRMNMSNAFVFKPKLSEAKVIVDDVCPAGCGDKDMMEILNKATADSYSFLHIYFGKGVSDMFRKNLTTVLSLE